MKLIDRYTGLLRQLRLLQWAYNALHYRQLSANKALYRKYGLHRSVLGSLDSRVIAAASPEIPAEQAPDGVQVPWPEDFQQYRSNWEADGFIHLPSYFQEELLNAVNEGLQAALEQKTVHFNYTGRKIFNAQQAVPALYNITLDRGIHSLLSAIFGRRPLHFQTINFLFGSEQQAHSDAVHMTTHPLGFLAGVWVALEEVTADNGPLTYFPGSHKLPYILNADYGNRSNALLLDGNANERYEAKVAEVIEEHGLVKKELYAAAGDVFIWHANLLHGGAPIRDRHRTRRSMVSHYFAEQVICYHEISERPAIIPR